ncbi:MAG TPA: GNAT family N-acetyltransferase [Solirubrobacteraceae bacterium]|nr:GNAT family N-acetyltransferase [Solirubrobacteraceae bacterium]
MTAGAVVVRELRPGDAAGAAALHRRAFPGAFLTRLGAGALTHIYAEVVRRPDGHGAVALQGDRIVGAAIAVRSSAELWRALARRHTGGLAWGVAAALARDPRLVAHLARRGAHVRAALGGRGRRGRPPAPSRRAPAGPSARLLSIGVDPAHRGQGLAGRLVDAVCAALAGDGVAVVGLSVRRDNPDGLRFYERTGWERVRADATGVYLRRPTT